MLLEVGCMNLSVMFYSKDSPLMILAIYYQNGSWQLRAGYSYDCWIRHATQHPFESTNDVWQQIKQ